MLKRGYFSETHKARWGSCWWSTPSGRVVEITSISEPTPESDCREVGEVTEWHHGQMALAAAEVLDVEACQDASHKPSAEPVPWAIAEIMAALKAGLGVWKPQPKEEAPGGGHEGERPC